MVGEFSRLRLYSLAAIVVLPFSSVCLSYAWAIACSGWPYSFSMRPSSLVVPACFCGSFLLWRSCAFLLTCCSARGRRLLSLLLVFASVPLPAAPAVFRGVSCRRLPLGGYAPFLAPDACPAPAVELCLWGLRCQPYCCTGGVGWGCRPSLVDSVLLLHRLACRCLLSSAPCDTVFVSALCMAVWWCLMAPRAFRALLVVLSSLLAVLSLCGCCTLSTVWFPLPSGACASGLRCLRRKLAAKLVQSRLPFVVSPPSDISIYPSPALAGLVIWSQSFGPSCCSCVLGSRGVSGAAFCSLGLLSHPLLLLFLA